MSDWAVEPHAVPPELQDNYTPTRSHWATLQDKLDHATITQLRAIMHGGIGQPDTTPTPQTDQLTDKERAAVISRSNPCHPSNRQQQSLTTPVWGLTNVREWPVNSRG